MPGTDQDCNIKNILAVFKVLTSFIFKILTVIIQFNSIRMKRSLEEGFVMAGFLSHLIGQFFAQVIVDQVTPHNRTIAVD